MLFSYRRRFRKLSNQYCLNHVPSMVTRCGHACHSTSQPRTTCRHTSFLQHIRHSTRCGTPPGPPLSLPYFHSRRPVISRSSHSALFPKELVTPGHRRTRLPCLLHRILVCRGRAGFIGKASYETPSVFPVCCTCVPPLCFIKVRLARVSPSS